MTALHKVRTHPGPDVTGCFGCKAATLTVGAVRADTSEMAQRERDLATDMDAYQRMKRAGHQPAHLRGSAMVEREARSPVEITHPRLIALPDEARAHAAAAAEVAVDLHPVLEQAKEATG